MHADPSLAAPRARPRPRPGLGLGLGLGLALALLGLAARASEPVDPARLPPPAPRTIDYDRDVRPLFEASCFQCHGPERPKSNFRLDNRASALKGGRIGVPILPGDGGQSPLVHYVARLVEDLEMPPPRRGEPLTPEQIGVLRAWIDQGARYPGSAAQPSLQRWWSVSPAFRWVGVRGNAARFREDAWMPEGASGGLEAFRWVEPLGEGERFTAEGRGWLDAHDYRLRVSYEKSDVGFVRAGFEQFRRWTDDTGGFHPAFGGVVPRLDRDLHLDIGRAWFEAGLTRPGGPRLTVGYEYQQRDGAKASTQWGLLTDAAGTDLKAVYPTFKEVDEAVHVVTVDVRHELQGVQLEDQFRAEFYDLRTRRETADFFTLGRPLADSLTRSHETADHFRVSNTLQARKPLRDWLIVSGGYLYSRLDGQASFNTETYLPGDLTLPPGFVGDATDQVVLRQTAHVFNLNSQLGPWHHVSLAAGVQSEWSRQEGFGHATVAGFPSPYHADLDRAAVDETLHLRFTGLPHTVVFAESRFQQVRYGQFERDAIGDGFDDERDFVRDTDARERLLDGRAGFTVSPWTRVSFTGSARHRTRSTDYFHRTDDAPPGTPGNGYAAFLRSRDLATDELESKLVLHPRRWLKTTLKHQLVRTDYDAATVPGTDPGTGVAFAGGPLRAAAYAAHIYSLGATLTPWRRLYLAPGLSYSQSRLRSALNDDALIAPYRGGVWTLVHSTTFAWTETTDLHATFSFVRADFAPAHATLGLPLGIDFKRYGLMAGLTRRFKRDLSVRLEYGWRQHEEPTAAGAADYTAHGVFATVTKVWR